MSRPGVSALMFHHVGPVRPGAPPALTVSPGRFRRILEALQRSGHVGIAARDWADGATSSARGRPVILTFDDAYADLTEFALPVLDELGYGATVFAVGGAIGGTNAWDAGAGGREHRLMSADDLRAWRDAGFEVGAHGMTHVDLTTVADDELVVEVERVQQVLADVVEGPVSSFAYPYGRHDHRVREAVLRQYRLGFGIEEGRNHPHSDRSRLRRTMVQPADTALDAVLRARLGWSPLQRARAVVRPRSRLRAVQRGRR